MLYIFPNASIEKSIGHFLCCFATKNPMASGDITVLFNKCFAFCLSQSRSFAQKANNLRRAAVFHDVANATTKCYLHFARLV